MNDSFSIREYRASDQNELITLWKVCGLTRPWNDPKLDIDRKLSGQPNWILIGETESGIIASVMVGYDGHRGWVNYLAVHPSNQQLGYGHAMMNAAEIRLKELGCPKINLQVRAQNADALAFYEAIGFKQDDVVSLGKRLIEDC